jgi:hypothetical protein
MTSPDRSLQKDVFPVVSEIRFIHNIFPLFLFSCLVARLINTLRPAKEANVACCLPQEVGQLLLLYITLIWPFAHSLYYHIKTERKENTPVLVAGH